MINFYLYYSGHLDYHDSYSHLIVQIIDYGEADNDILPIKHIIKKSPEYAYLYARDTIKGRWEEAEPYIMTDCYWAYNYARDIIKGRWFEAEQIIMKDVDSAYRYALHVIGGRWFEAEPYIMESPYYAYYYAILVIKDRFIEAEEYIKEDKDWWVPYCRKWGIDD